MAYSSGLSPLSRRLRTSLSHARPWPPLPLRRWRRQISGLLHAPNMPEIQPLRNHPACKGFTKSVFRSLPTTERIRDDWGAETFSVELKVDPDRANLAGVTNVDVALSLVTAMNGYPVSQMYDDHRQIPILARMRSQERAELSDIENLYVSSSRSQVKIPLRQVSRIGYRLQTEKSADATNSRPPSPASPPPAHCPRKS